MRKVKLAELYRRVFADSSHIGKGFGHGLRPRELECVAVKPGHVQVMLLQSSSCGKRGSQKEASSQLELPRLAWREGGEKMFFTDQWLTIQSTPNGHSGSAFSQILVLRV